MKPAIQLLLLMVLLLVPGGSAQGAAPPCVTQCEKLARDGELRSNVSPEGCLIRVCQREARSLYRNQEFEKALLSLEPVRDSLEDSPSYQLELGLSYYALGRFPEALESFERILSGFPQNVRAAAQRAQTLIRLARFEEARAQFEALIANPAVAGEFKKLRTRSYLRGSIGVVLLAEGELEQGKAALEQALEIDGRNRVVRSYLLEVVPHLESGMLGPEAIPLLVAAYEELDFKRFVRAAHELKEIVRRWPRYGRGYHLLSEIQRSYQQFEACEATLVLGQAHLPQDIDLRAERLRCALLRHGPTSKEAGPALQELRALAGEYPGNERIQQIRAALDL